MEWCIWLWGFLFAVQVISSPSDVSSQYIKQRDDNELRSCEFSQRKVSVLSIMGSDHTLTLHIQHYQGNSYNSGNPRYVFDSLKRTKSFVSGIMLHRWRCMFSFTLNNRFKRVICSWIEPHLLHCMCLIQLKEPAQKSHLFVCESSWSSSLHYI